VKLSIVIPAYNEEGSIEKTIKEIYNILVNEKIPHEILVVNDKSSDKTLELLEFLSKEIKTLKHYTNPGPNGFGFAIRYGLDKFSGECVAIMMADLSDSPNDLVLFYKKMVEDNLDCVFGSRFIKGGKTVDYPPLKKLINRIANFIIRILIGISYNDTTNAFKLYKREAIEGIKPIISPHFNLTIELPLKAIIRGFSYGVVPNSWKNRQHGVSKLKIREMGSRYFFILMYCFFEKYFSKGDFKKKW
jgi:dolichol-phosphate mannosyltransferase|tara:strand:- start:629 stop:1366 length:738 start_codon:yes stop_codon:yes gene_type:complete